MVYVDPDVIPDIFREPGQPTTIADDMRHLRIERRRAQDRNSSSGPSSEPENEMNQPPEWDGRPVQSSREESPIDTSPKHEREY